MNEKDIKLLYDAINRVESTSETYARRLKNNEVARKDLDNNIKDLQHSFQEMRKAKENLKVLKDKHGVV